MSALPAALEPEVHDDVFPAPRLILSEPPALDGDDFLRLLARRCRVSVAPAAAVATQLDVDGVVVKDAGGALTDACPNAAIEQESNLLQPASRERFLTLLFALARLRDVELSHERSALVGFHARYKYTLLAYDEIGMRELGRIAASVADHPWPDTIARYRARFARAFHRPAAVGAHINALLHAFGHLSDVLSGAERQFFLQQLDELRAGKLPLAGALMLLREWVVRLDVPYLAAQAYFTPYPAEFQ